MFQRVCNIFCPQDFFISYINLESKEQSFHFKSIERSSFLINDLNIFIAFQFNIEFWLLGKYFREISLLADFALALHNYAREIRWIQLFKFTYHQDADLGLKEKVSPIKGSHRETLYCSL